MSLTTYPHRQRPPETGPSRRTRLIARVMIWCLAAAATLAASVGMTYGVLWAFNPMGDEWVCSEGEAPTTQGCYPEGADLPAGVRWEQFGNRPMPYNCEKDGWVSIERTVTRRGATDVVEDCVREGTDLPGNWRLSEDE